MPVQNLWLHACCCRLHAKRSSGRCRQHETNATLGFQRHNIDRMDQWRAARLGRVDILDDILAEEGANPNLTRWSGSTALHKAAAEGHADCVELLLDKGADVNMRAAWGWYSPLHLAMRGGHEDVGMLLLERGGNWKAVDKHNKTPMRWAIDAGHVVEDNIYVIGAVTEQAVSYPPTSHTYRRVGEPYPLMLQKQLEKVSFIWG